jgi:hypothetical protein
MGPEEFDDIFVISTGGPPCGPERRNLAANGRGVMFEARCLDFASLDMTIGSV